MAGSIVDKCFKSIKDEIVTLTEVSTDLNCFYILDPLQVSTELFTQ